MATGLSSCYNKCCYSCLVSICLVLLITGDVVRLAPIFFNETGYNNHYNNNNHNKNRNSNTNGNGNRNNNNSSSSISSNNLIAFTENVNSLRRQVKSVNIKAELDYDDDNSISNDNNNNNINNNNNNVPDFMRLLYYQYQSKLTNFTIEIDGRLRNLGSISLIQSHRLSSIQRFSIPFTFKLIFRSTSNASGKSALSIVKTLRLHKHIFPSFFHKTYSNIQSYFTVAKVYNHKMEKIREKLISNKSFNHQGWISIDLLGSPNTTFYLKFDGFWRQMKSGKFVHQKSWQLKRKRNRIIDNCQKLPYYAHLITIYRDNDKYNKNNDNFNSSSNDNVDTSTVARRHQEPIMELLKQEVVLQRHKRQVPRNNNSPKNLYISQFKSNEDHKNLCNRHPLQVNFGEVGWSRWVIAPHSYNAYYCQGRCPYPLSDHFSPTNHAIIQLLVHGVKDSSIPRPCCVPHKLSPATMLYLNSEGDALLQQFNDMTVESCSCQ